MEIRANEGEILFEGFGSDREVVGEAAKSGVDLRNSNLRGLDLHGLELRGIDLSSADFSGSGVSQARLIMCSFFRAKFVGTNLRESFLHYSSFVEAVEIVI